MTTIRSDATAPVRPTRTAWPAVAITVFFGLFYAYDVWEAVGSLVLFPGELQQNGATISPELWVVLIVGVVAPVLGFVTALLLGLRRSLTARAVLYVVGLAAVAAVGLAVLRVGALIGASLA